MEVAVFHLPDLGEGLTDAEIVEWRVAVGDTVRADDIVVEVETAKAVVEVPVPYAGVVHRLHGEPGGILAVGAPLISVEVPATQKAESSESSAARQYRAEERAGSGNVLVGYGTGPERAARSRRFRSVAPPAAPMVISPLVRALARDNGVDVAALTPSGPQGVVLRRDVEAAIRARAAAPTLAPAASPTAVVSTVDDDGPALEGAARRIPLRGLRRTVATAVSRSRAEIPDVTIWVDVDATPLLAARDDLRNSRSGNPVGLLALLARICLVALREYPELNSTVDTEAQEVVQFSSVHLGVAVDSDRGLVVPVLRDADRRTVPELADELTTLVARARAGELSPGQLTRGTFTLNNYGVFGVDGSTPNINYPQAGLLGVGRIVDKPWVVDGALAVRKVTQLTLTFDHRVCDGGTAGGFLRLVADLVEHPTRLLAYP
jgi:pyruvate dehydrogenase E2 component (dihydrolipoamide acetyltransferase)